MGTSGLLSPLHLFILLLVLLLLFGAKRLPEIGRSLGTGMREFKDSVTSSSSDKVEARSELPPPSVAPPLATPPAATPPVGSEAASAPAETAREAEPVT